MKRNKNVFPTLLGLLFLSTASLVGYNISKERNLFSVSAESSADFSEFTTAISTIEEFKTFIASNGSGYLTADLDFDYSSVPSVLFSINDVQIKLNFNGHKIYFRNSALYLNNSFVDFYDFTNDGVTNTGGMVRDLTTSSLANVQLGVNNSTVKFYGGTYTSIKNSYGVGFVNRLWSTAGQSYVYLYDGIYTGWDYVLTIGTTMPDATYEDGVDYYVYGGQFESDTADAIFYYKFSNYFNLTLANEIDFKIYNNFEQDLNDIITIDSSFSSASSVEIASTTYVKLFEVSESLLDCFSLTDKGVMSYDETTHIASCSPLEITQQPYSSANYKTICNVEDVSYQWQVGGVLSDPVTEDIIYVDYSNYTLSGENNYVADTYHDDDNDKDVYYVLIYMDSAHFEGINDLALTFDSDNESFSVFDLDEGYPYGYLTNDDNHYQFTFNDEVVEFMGLHTIALFSDNAFTLNNLRISGMGFIDLEGTEAQSDTLNIKKYYGHDTYRCKATSNANSSEVAYSEPVSIATYSLTYDVMGGHYLKELTLLIQT